jgi:hypothetical protein
MLWHDTASYSSYSSYAYADPEADTTSYDTQTHPIPMQFIS